MERPPKKRAPSWSRAFLVGPVLWEPLILDAKAVCHLSLSSKFIGLSPGSEKILRAYIDFTGPVATVACSQYAPVDEGQDMTHAGNPVHSIDIRKHKSCYAIFAASADMSNARVGWAVFDEGRLIDGPFLAITISENLDDTDDNIPLVVSYNILVHEQLGTRHAEYRRVEEGEISETGYLADESQQSLRIT